MGEEKEYGLLIAAIVSIVAIVGLVILFSRSGAPVGKLVAVEGAPATSYFTGEGSLYYGGVGGLRYRDCVEDSACESGYACYKSSTVGMTGGRECLPTNWGESPKGQIDATSGRGFWT